MTQADRLMAEGIKEPDPQTIVGWHLIEALMYWGAYTEKGLSAMECKSIADIEGLDQEDAKTLRILSLAFLDGLRRGENPLGIPPRIEDGQDG